jgi:hypothetical protein
LCFFSLSSALRGWNQNPCCNTTDTNLPFQRPKQQQDRDFMALNKATVAAGLINARENYDYRATHDIRKKPPAEERRAGARRLPPNMVFGLPTR